MDVDLDLDDPKVLLRGDVVADPMPFYLRLRRAAPVWQVPGQDTFLVSDPGHVREAVGRPDDLSSNLVTLLRNDGDGGTEPYGLLPYGDPMHVLATADPPVHTRHRRLLQQHLSPAAVAALTPDIERIVDEQLTTMLGAGPVDAVAGFGDAVATRVVCRLIGLPEVLWPRISDLVLRTGALLDGVTTRAGTDAASVAALELASIVHEQLDRVRALPPDDQPGLLGVFGTDVAAG
ncbi:MAG: cytochrome P450, partial [Acidimicrobiales bacterium]|nr:cytochrome P450 [Acidimicrobiales bacterium]